MCVFASLTYVCVYMFEYVFASFTFACVRAHMPANLTWLLYVFDVCVCVRTCPIDLLTCLPLMVHLCMCCALGCIYLPYPYIIDHLCSIWWQQLGGDSDKGNALAIIQSKHV